MAAGHPTLPGNFPPLKYFQKDTEVEETKTKQKSKKKTTHLLYQSLDNRKTHILQPSAWVLGLLGRQEFLTKGALVGIEGVRGTSLGDEVTCKEELAQCWRGPLLSEMSMLGCRTWPSEDDAHLLLEGRAAWGKH